MSKELKGYTNKLQENNDGSITKFFSDDGVISRSALIRLNTEKQILKLVPLAPNLISETSNSLTISTIEGERNLDRSVDQMQEGLQLSLFESIGESLAFLHDRYRNSVSENYINSVICDAYLTVKATSRILEQLGIDTELLSLYFCNSINLSEVKKLGVVITHGDYWLNNIIGQVRRNRFTVAGVVDWEMGGIASPYCDFANVYLSIFNYHPLATETFWNGYGFKPDGSTLAYFCAKQIVTWINEDKSPDFSSNFYLSKLEFLRRLA